MANAVYPDSGDRNRVKPRVDVVALAFQLAAVDPDAPPFITPWPSRSPAIPGQVAFGPICPAAVVIPTWPAMIESPM